MEPQVWMDLEDCQEEDLEGTQDLQDHPGQGDSQAHLDHQEKMGLMDLLESRGSRVRQEAQDWLVYLVKKAHQVKRERRAMEASLAFLELQVFVEKEEVQELLVFLDQKDRKENL